MTRLKGARVLVTGGCGFIGSHLVDALQDIGAEITVLDTINCLVTRKTDGIKLVTTDLRDETRVRRAVKGNQFVFHLAANAEVPASVKNPVDTHMVNVVGAMHVALACAEYKAKLIFSSSCSVYGDRGSDPCKEWEPKQPESPYALQKLTVEGYVRIFGNLHGLDGTSLRYFNVYGPRQNPASSYSGVVAKFCHAALHDQGVTIYGDGKQTRDFIYVDDVVRANLIAAISAEARGQVFNVGTGRRTNLLDLVQALREITGNAINVTHLNARPGDVRHSYASTEFTRDTLGFVASHDMTSGLAKTLHSMK